LLPPLDRLELVNDKAAICRIAAGLGIGVPSTWERTRALSNGPPDSLTYPCVLKWRDPELVVDRLDARSLPC
jgi:predicted ATP-grasp superfamily ATP-dependent carboligase